MSKALKIAAVVVGVAAITIATFGLAAPAATAAALGTIASGLTVSTAVTILAVTSTLLSVAAGLTAKKPKIGSAGTQLDFIADPTAGEPYVMGDAMVGEMVVHQASSGAKNKNLGMVGVMSLGPIFAYTSLYADGNAVTFSSGNATGYYHDFMYLQTQLGAQPEAASLTPPSGFGLPDWTFGGVNRKLSGLAANLLTLVADVDNGKIFSAGVPKLTHRIKGVLAYDARSDGTNGGTGSQRYLTESTYAYSENPWAHHGTFAIGRWQNGSRVIGPGLPPTSIDWGSHIDAANVADTNHWKVSGRIMSTDNKWDVLKAIAQAGGGYPVSSGTKLFALVNTPRVSLASIEESDLKGPAVVPQMAMRRDRLNGAIPRFRSAAHGWEIIPGNTIRNSAYLAEDGGTERTREVEFALVADNGDGVGATQAAQLVGYDVANSREKIGIQLELGLVWSQYKMGDCLTLNLPKALLVNQKAVIIGRTFNAARRTVTLEFRTETDAKHTWVLGLTGSITTPPTVVTPIGTGDGGTETAVQTQNLINASFAIGMTFALDSTGHLTISNHTRTYPDKTVSVTGTAGTPIATGGTSGKRVYAFYDDDLRAGGAVTYQYLVLPSTGGDASSTVASTAHPSRHFLLLGIVPASGSSGGGSDPGSGGGGTTAPCVTVDTEITLHDGSTVLAGSVERYMQLRTVHEFTGVEGIYHVTEVEIVHDQPVWLCTIDGKTVRATEDHRIMVEGEWKTAGELGTADGNADVVKMTVADAHTYISNGLLSHNIKIGGD